MNLFDGEKALAGLVQTRDSCLNGFQQLDYTRHLQYIKVSGTCDVYVESTRFTSTLPQFSQASRPFFGKQNINNFVEDRKRYVCIQTLIVDRCKYSSARRLSIRLSYHIRC